MRRAAGWWVAVVWVLMMSAAIPVGWSPSAHAQTFCGWQAKFPGTTGSAGFTITPGVEAMPRSILVRTTTGTPATLSTAVDHGIAALNQAAGVAWRRGPDVTPPAGLSTADARHRPPPGELWVVGNPRLFPRLPPGTYASSVVRRIGRAPAMPVSTIVVLADALGAPGFSDSRRRNAVIHEFGHAAGLDHHFAPWGGRCQVMSYGGSTTYEAGDIAGLQLLASRSPARPPWGDPFGNLDLVRRSAAGIEVAGWAADPDTVGATVVHLYANGRYRRAIATTMARRDVVRLHPELPVSTGFTATIPLPPGQPVVVCAYAINVGPGTTNPLLGCALAPP